MIYTFDVWTRAVKGTELNDSLDFLETTLNAITFMAVFVLLCLSVCERHAVYTLKRGNQNVFVR